MFSIALSWSWILFSCLLTVSFINSFINSETVKKINQKLNEVDWNEVKSCEHPSESYEIFLTKFLSIYDAFFPKKKIKVKTFKVLG